MKDLLTEVKGGLREYSTSDRRALEEQGRAEPGGKFQYRNLAQAGTLYGYDAILPGKTEIWYMKPDYFRDLIMGPEFVAQHRPEILPRKPADLKKTHILVGKVNSRDPEEIWRIMQGEHWSPKGEARNLIKKLGLRHTSMSVGDVVVLPGNKIMMVDRAGFRQMNEEVTRESAVMESLHEDVELLLTQGGAIDMRLSQQEASRWGASFWAKGPHMYNPQAAYDPKERAIAFKDVEDAFLAVVKTFPEPFAQAFREKWLELAKLYGRGMVVKNQRKHEDWIRECEQDAKALMHEGYISKKTYEDFMEVMDGLHTFASAQEQEKISEGYVYTNTDLQAKLLELVRAKQNVGLDYLLQNQLKGVDPDNAIEAGQRLADRGLIRMGTREGEHRPEYYFVIAESFGAGEVKRLTEAKRGGMGAELGALKRELESTMNGLAAAGFIDQVTAVSALVSWEHAVKEASAGRIDKARSHLDQAEKMIKRQSGRGVGKMAIEKYLEAAKQAYDLLDQAAMGESSQDADQVKGVFAHLMQQVPGTPAGGRLVGAMDDVIAAYNKGVCGSNNEKWESLTYRLGLAIKDVYPEVDESVYSDLWDLAESMYRRGVCEDGDEYEVTVNIQCEPDEDDGEEYGDDEYGDDMESCAAHKRRKKGRKTEELHGDVIQVMREAMVVEPHLRPIVESVGVGHTIENDNVRIHRYYATISVTDLTNAGKRGKRVDRFRLYNLDYSERNPEIKALVEAFVNKLAKFKTYRQALEAVKQLVADAETIEGGGFYIPKISQDQIKGVDIAPAGFEPIKMKGIGVSIEADYDSFRVVNVADEYNLETCIPAIKGGKKDIKVFYRWVKDNMRKLEKMNFREVVRAMMAEKISFHQYCAMD